MAFAHQVGGHAATILASPLSSSTLIKPAHDRELDFYQRVGPQLADGLLVREWTPGFYGTLRAHRPPPAAGQGDDTATAAQEDNAAVLSRQPDMLVLENLTHRFLRPNVLDIKLGTQLYDEEATDEKKERMRKAAEATTSATTGIRLTGFQVWNRDTQAYVQTDKAFGKSLKADELALGFARFFCPPDSPLSRAERRISDATESASASETSDASTASSRAGGSTASPRTNPPPPALPLDLLLIVLRTLLRRLKQLIALLSTVEMRMRGGSLLIVVEGDPDALERAVLRLAGSQREGAPASQSAESDNCVAVNGHAGSEGQDDDDDDDAASVSTTDEEGNAKPETLLPLEMRLIDFAHTRAASGEGPDEGVLLGLKTTERLWEELVARLEDRERQEERGR